MFRDFILQFFMELLRALLTEELSLRARRGLADWLALRGARRGGQKMLFREVHGRVRKRLINRLRTGADDEP